MAALIKKSQYGLRGDITSDSIQKVLSFHTQPTAKLISKIGFGLRAKINTAVRAKGKKGFVEDQPISFEEVIKEKERQTILKTN